MRVLPASLIGLSPGDLTPHGVNGFLVALRSALEGGLRCLLLREPDWEHGPLLELAQQVSAEMDSVSAQLILHDVPHLARAANATGVHLGFRSLAPERVREWLPQEVAIGLSTHASDAPVCETQRIEGISAGETRAGGSPHASVDFVFFSPVFETPSKRGVLDPVGLPALVARVQESAVPVYALGGIGPSNAAQVWSTGVAGLVVRSAIWGHSSPARCVREILEMRQAPEGAQQ